MTLLYTLTACLKSLYNVELPCWFEYLHDST